MIKTNQTQLKLQPHFLKLACQKVAAAVAAAAATTAAAQQQQGEVSISN